MSIHFPDAVTVRSALSLAIRAPSVHNVQPWKWRVGAESLHLYSDPTRHLVHTDPDGRDMMVSCGVALNHCVIGLAALGWRSKIHRFPNPAEPTHLASIELQRQTAGELDIALAAAIPRRRTDRRYFSAWQVSHADIALMGARAARMGVSMRRIEPSTDVRAALAQAVWSHATDREYLEELTMWSGRYASTAGVPARSTPESDPNSPIPGRFFAGTALAQPAEAAPADDHGALLALGTSDDDDMARLRAGEATSLVLLTATALGLASCPVTEPLELGETRAAIRADAFDDERFPQMLLRVGWAPINADPLPSTPRRPLDDVVARLDDTRLE
ncbi:NAD(P)H nitroreductase [Mycolicibacterium sp. P9-64]|uniref:Acg family FMN-binding oxidoreductase n=1 Tax=Mycolicibacterium sp. P9-64 TaxID=2024612 RepID=UPI0011ECB16E|nr:NAD(P)H nitroreductase [Mycolicibacterium sp. P9-64]KAA0079355.1 NAD(P)H nitroreductase [Mycolicibacterium sp. P9-64]